MDDRLRRRDLRPEGRGEALDRRVAAGQAHRRRQGRRLDGPHKPWKVRFAEAGRYTLGSVFHPSKTLQVTVKKSRKGVPTAAQEKRALAKQVKASTKLARKPATFEGPGGNAVRVGNDAEGIAFFPARKTVKVGDTVTFEMSKSSIEMHNVHLGPKHYLDGFAQSFLGEVFQPFVLHRSDAPGTAVSYDGSNHGNGYFNTGILDTDAGRHLPLLLRAVHGNDMTGEIVVQ